MEDSQGSSIDENRGLNLILFDSLALSVSGKRWLSCNPFLPWSQRK